MFNVITKRKIKEEKIVFEVTVTENFPQINNK
jgi:hypothetical protein